MELLALNRACDLAAPAMMLARVMMGVVEMKSFPNACTVRPGKSWPSGKNTKTEHKKQSHHVHSVTAPNE